MSNSRVKMASRNVLWAYINMLVTTILKFAVRCAFIQTIGATYLGINGLYTSILHVLSLTELGIGTAIGYSLYKPVAIGDTESVKSLMQFYKSAYRLIALVVCVLGISLIPFLRFIVKGGENVDHLILYYVLFLINTVSSYFVSYKYSLNNAEQKGYLINNINSVTNVVTSIVQIIVLFVYHSFLGYLVVQIAFQLCNKLFASIYLDRHYPYLRDKNINPLGKEKKSELFRNVRALIVHKFGDIAVNQTDNIIISSFINITITGLVSNYILLIGTIENIVGVVFGNIIGSLGNLCATASKEKQYQIFKVCDMLGFLFFGFSTIAFICLVQPFVFLMWGNEYVLDNNVILLILINFYCVGQRVPLGNMKMAQGVFIKDRYLPFFQAITNLVTSIVLVKWCGLIGVYWGTIISGIIPTFVRPFMIFHILVDKSPLCYFKSFAAHFVTIAIIAIPTYLICAKIIGEPTWCSFICGMIFVSVVPTAVLYLVICKTDEYKYLSQIIGSFTNRFRRKGTP